MKKRLNYWNPLTRKYGFIEYPKPGGKYFAVYDGNVNPHPSFGAAFDELKNAGYEPNGIIDETGCRRYTMTVDELQSLYKRFEDFVADCTQQEYNENKSAIIAVYTLIKKHIDAEIKK